MATLRENNNANDNGDGAFGPFGPLEQRVSQSFTASVSYELSSVKFLLFKSGTPGTITLIVYAADGSDFPTGASLGSGTTDGNTLPAASPGEWREITLSSAIPLILGNKYCLTLYCAGTEAGHRLENPGSYAGGLMATSSNDGPNWISQAPRDIMFENYGDPAPPGKAQNPTPVDTAENIRIVGRNVLGVLEWEAPD